MKKILVTGASGFVGSHLIDYLLATTTDHIYGTYRGEEPAGEGERLKFVQLDLKNKESIDAVLTNIKPDYFYHLAAQSNVPKSIQDPISTFHDNVDTLLNILLSLRDLEMQSTRMLLVSSAEVYGNIVPDDLPVTEQAPHRPANPYAVSKLTQDYLGYQFSLSHDLDIVRVRPFNHIGPRQTPYFVVSDFAKQIAEIEKGGREPIMHVGNLEAKRDFTDVRDMVKLYTILMDKGKKGDVYNAGSGTSVSIQDVLDMMLALSEANITIEQDPNKLRPSDIPEIVADSSKATSLTGWKTAYSLKDTLQDTLDYWREIV